MISGKTIAWRNTTFWLKPKAPWNRADRSNPLNARSRFSPAIQCGIVLLAVCFSLGYVLTTTFTSINAIMFIVFALVGLAWAAINVNSLPMVVEMCKGSDIGKFTGYYYTASMAAQVVTPVVVGTLMRNIDYRVLFPYAALFVALSFVTMLFVQHGDVKSEAKKGLDAFEEMDD